MRHLLALVKLLFSVVIVGAVLHHVGTDDVLEAISNAAFGPILIAAVVLLASFAVGALRWCWILSHSGAELSFAAALRLLLEALFFNQLLPSMIGGDAVRVVRASTSANVSLSDAFRSVVVDRVTGLFALCALTAGALVAVYFTGLPLEPAVICASIVMLGLGLFGAMVLAGIGLLANDDWERWVPDKLRRAYRQIVLVGQDFVRLNSSLRNFLALNGLGIAVHILVIASMFFIGYGLGIRCGFLPYFVAVPISILVSAMPISIAGWGVREAMMVAAFAGIGVDEGAALSTSLLFGAILALMGLVGGVFFLIRRDRVAFSARMRESRPAAT